MSDNEVTEKLVRRKELLRALGVSDDALSALEKVADVSAVTVDGRVGYPEEYVELFKAMLLCQGRSASLAEAYKIARQGLAAKKRRNKQLSSLSKDGKAQQAFMDPKQIRTHPAFEDALPRSKDLLEDITNDMALNGYRPSDPIALATWPEQEEPVVYDGHTRRLAAIASGIELVPVVIENLESEAAAMEEFTKSQIMRRPNDQWVRYRLIIMYDRVKPRGGDRRSEQAKSKGPQEPIETGYSTSAERTAALVGTSATTVKRVRRINKEATPEILEKLQNRKITIREAEKEVIKLSKAKETTEAESPVAENQDAKVWLTDENLAGLEKLGGNRHDHVNLAVEQYIERELRKRASSERQDSEVDDQKPRIIQ